ncbi:MAG: NAD(P)-dependent oxidoreductase [Isosphaeraceae bacterium]
MRVGVTGATGFLGRYIVSRLTADGHVCRCWYRPSSDLGGIDTKGGSVVWVEGSLGDPKAEAALVQDCDAVVHAALDRPGPGFRGAEGDVVSFVERNVLGTLRLIEAARKAGVGRFVFISTCAVHEAILDDRPLDETHPLWPRTHYGAHKAAIEAFVQSYGKGQGYPICALRPTGIYGVARPLRASKWYDLVSAVARGEEVECLRGGKEVHAADVARAVALLLNADAATITGEAFACYDRYISEFEVATIAKRLSGSQAVIAGAAPTPKNQIVTEKIRALGMTFGGLPLLEETIQALLAGTR